MRTPSLGLRHTAPFVCIAAGTGPTSVPARPLTELARHAVPTTLRLSGAPDPGSGE